MATSGYILSEEHKALAQVLAEISFAKYQNNPGHYRNLLNSHLVGRLGEFASFTLLHDLGFHPVINAGTKDGDKLADIHCDIGRVEVKTWSAKHWVEYGRCVSVSQLASIRKKADIILWCVADDVDSDTPKVVFKGFNDVQIVDKNPATYMGVVTRQVLNHQLDESDLQPLSELTRGSNYATARHSA